MSVRSSRSERLLNIRHRGGTANDERDLEEAVQQTFTATSGLEGNAEQKPTIDPYVGKLERYELFCTNQSYYLVGCNKRNTAYRVLKMDRTLIERPQETNESPRAHSEPIDHTNPSSTLPRIFNCQLHDDAYDCSSFGLVVDRCSFCTPTKDCSASNYSTPFDCLAVSKLGQNRESLAHFDCGS